MNRMHRWTEGIARLFLAGIFLTRSVILLVRPEAEMQRMAEQGLPLVPFFFIVAQG